MTLLIHPGFHKTGTSWLQEMIFSESSVFSSLLDHGAIDQLFLRDHDFDFDASHAQTTVAEALAGAPENTIPVISSEILSGNPFDGSRDSKMLAERLHAANPDARILLTIRRPTAFAKGMYLQYLKRGGRKTAAQFFSYEPEPGYRWFTMECLKFGRLADHYADLFGAEKVCVLPQEWLGKDREAYLTALVEFASGKKGQAATFPRAANRVGQSPPESGLFLMRRGNMFYRSTMNPEAVSPQIIGRILQRAAYSWSFGKARAAMKLNAEIERFVPTTGLAESNSALQKYCPVDLGAFGYEMPAPTQSA